MPTTISFLRLHSELLERQLWPSRALRTACRAMNQSFTDKNWKQVQELASLLNRVLPQGNLRTNIQNGLETSVNESLQKGELEQLTSIWPAAQILNDHPAEFATSIADKASDMILRTLLSDDAALGPLSLTSLFGKRSKKTPKPRLLLPTDSLVLQNPSGCKMDKKRRASSLCR